MPLKILLLQSQAEDLHQRTLFERAAGRGEFLPGRGAGQRKRTYVCKRYVRIRHVRLGSLSIARNARRGYHFIASASSVFGALEAGTVSLAF